jgi:crossover junction endodeoxyribonuclease RuvC
MRYVGVDPGLSGAFVTLDVAEDGTQAVTTYPVPVAWLEVHRGRRRFYDVPVLWKQLQAVRPVTLAYVEQQGARPGQGVTSTFSIGQGFGMWHALLVAAAIPFVVVAPQRWRARVGLPKTATTPQGRKKAVALAACRRFPGIAIKLDHADAVMLAVAAALEHGVT